MSGWELGPERTYFAALERGEFLIQRCRECARHVFYPRVVCPHCGSNALAWVKPSGRGTVYSTTIVRRGVEVGPDINVSLIELEEGVRVMSRVDSITPAQVKIGMNVVASVVSAGSDHLLVFHAVAGVSGE